jgi:uncharacterized protein YaiE (UPF0345 family)
MAKSYFLPADEPGKLKWLNNFAAKLPTYAATVGVTPAEVTQTTADDAYFAFVVGAQNQHSKTTRDWTAYKNALRSGTTIGAMPTTPALGVPPTAVPAGIFSRVSALAARIKKHPAYTEAIG